mmetsp:Transcript_17369/g.56851  ORF Transcript_17369/g.56851 Transcript_17369/m.56851 type:complete len:210 (+) Transcript_17369:1710-2339(+)
MSIEGLHASMKRASSRAVHCVELPSGAWDALRGAPKPLTRTTTKRVRFLFLFFACPFPSSVLFSPLVPLIPEVVAAVADAARFCAAAVLWGGERSEEKLAHELFRVNAEDDNADERCSCLSVVLTSHRGSTSDINGKYTCEMKGSFSASASSRSVRQLKSPHASGGRAGASPSENPIGMPSRQLSEGQVTRVFVSSRSSSSSIARETGN